MKYLILFILIACEQPEYTPESVYCWKCYGQIVWQTSPNSAIVSELNGFYYNKTVTEIRSLEKKLFIDDKVKHLERWVKCEQSPPGDPPKPIE